MVSTKNRDGATVISRYGYKVALSLIVLIGFGLRIWGIGFELPIPWMSDETILLNPAKDIVRTGSLYHLPRADHWIAYPPLYSYVLASVIKALTTISQAFSSFSAIVDVSGSYAPFLIGRSVSAVFGTLTIVMAYLLGSKLFGRDAGLFSALTLALSFLHIQYSHYVKVDIMATFFGLASVLVAWEILRTRRVYAYLASGILGGLASATAFQASLFILPLSYASIISACQDWRTQRKSSAVAAALGVLATIGGLFIGFPHLFLNFTKIKADLLIVQLQGHYGSVVPILSDLNHISSARFYLEYLTRLDVYWTVLMCSLVGLRDIFRKKREEWMFFLVFPVAYAAVLAASSYRTDRALIPLLPFLAVLSGGGLVRLLGTIRQIKTPQRQPVLATMLAFVLLSGVYAVPVWRAIVFDYYSAKPGTGSTAVAWVQQHHRSDRLIFVDHATLSNYLQHVGFSESVVFDPSNADMIQRVAQFSGELFIHYVPLETIYWNYRNINNHDKIYEWYSQLHKTSELVAEFSNSEVERLFAGVRHLGPAAQAEYFHAPRIQILRLGLAGAAPFKYVYTPTLMPDNSMKRVADPTASYRLAMFGPEGRVSGISGPHVPVPRGEYRLTYRLKQNTTSAQPSHQVAHLFVRVSGRGSDIAGRALFARDFTVEDYITCDVLFSLPHAQRLEFGISTTGMANIWVDTITLESKKHFKVMR